MEKYNGVTSLPATKADLESWPRDMRGHHGVFLEYVTREEADPSHVDNAVNPNDPTDVKMTRKAPHLGDGLDADNGKVAEVVSHVSKGTDACTWVRAACLTIAFY